MARIVKIRLLDRNFAGAGAAVASTAEATHIHLNRAETSPIPVAIRGHVQRIVQHPPSVAGLLQLLGVQAGEPTQTRHS